MKKFDPVYCHYAELKRIKNGRNYQQKPWIITKQWIKYTEMQQSISDATNHDDAGVVIGQKTNINAPSKFALNSNDKLKDVVRKATRAYDNMDSGSNDSSTNSTNDNESNVDFASTTTPNINAANPQTTTFGGNQTLRKMFVLFVGLMFFGIGLATLASFTTFKIIISLNV